MSSEYPADVRLHIFRSQFLNAYARLEFSLGKLIQFARGIEAYAPIVQKMPFFLKEKRERLAEMAARDGPWNDQLEALHPALKGLAFFDDWRNTLAHSVGNVSDAHGQTVYVFNSVLIRDDKACNCVSTIDPRTADAFLEDVEALVAEIAKTLDTITGWTEADLPELLITLPTKP